MFMFLAMAWRNLWRNSRRTLTALAAVAGGVAVMVIISSTMNAMSDRMLEAATGSLIGHAQIHHQRYLEERLPTLTIEGADRVLAVVRRVDGVEAAAGRIYGYAHASIVRGCDGEVREGRGEEIAAPVVSLLGVEPRHEERVTDLAEHIVEGRWLEGGAEVVMSAGLARRTGARVGDAFLPTAADLHGAMRGPWAVSDEVPRVVGIVRTGMEEMDRMVVFMPRSYLASLARMEGQVHEIAIRTRDIERLEPVVEGLRRALEEARDAVVEHEVLPATPPLVISVGEEPLMGEQRLDGGLRASRSEPTRALLVGVDPGDVDGDGSGGEGLARGRFLLRSEDVVLTSRLAAALGVALDERVAVSVPVECGDGVPDDECPPSVETFLVVGVLSSEVELSDDMIALVTTSVVRDNVAALAPSSVAALAGDVALRVSAAARGARGARSSRDEVLTWYEVAPEIRVMMTVFDAAPVFMVIIIFLAVSIGIVNTLLMATFERIKEFGLMKALGMRPGGIIALVLAESALLALVGIAAGTALGALVVAYWSFFGLDMSIFMGEEAGFSLAGVNFDPVFWPRLTVADVIKTIIPVVFLTTLSGLWPAFRAARIEVTDALRHE